jgi:hypothetical protein
MAANYPADIFPNQEDRQYAEDCDLGAKRIREVMELLPTYKVGDVYLMKLSEEYGGKVQETRGVPHKYRCIFISEVGIPYFRRIDNHGKATGTVVSDVGDIFINASYEYDTSQMIPDPAQLDAILLNEEFDPVAEQARKAKLYAEIRRHNKSALIQSWGSDGERQIHKFFTGLKPGDTFWTGPNSCVVIEAMKPGRNIHEGTVTIKKDGKTRQYSMSFFRYRRLYRVQPRSYKKEAES